MSALQRSRAPDFENRRDEVVRATWQVISRDGLDKASMRAIAQELGCSTGVLTHYFRDKDELLSFAFKVIAHHIVPAKVDIANADEAMSAVRDVIASALPLDAHRRTWWRVWLSFTVVAFTKAAQTQSHARFYEGLRKYWTTALAELQARDVLKKELEPDLEADALLCLLDGIGVQALISPRRITPARQLAIVDAHLAHLVARD